MSGPFLADGPQKHPAVEETQVRAPSQEATRQTPVSQSPVKAAEQQALSPIPARIGTVDIEQFSRNLARLVEEGGRALAAYLKPREEGQEDNELADEITEVVKTLSEVAEYWLSDPQRTVELQTSLGKAYLDLWASAVRRLAGEPMAPVATPAAGDKRFSDPEWSQNQFFDFLKQAYLLTAQWADKLVANAADLSPHTKQKAEFYIRQITNALSPTNFVLTNPELL
ncbi:MAG: class I poly(R)-hydroxyalkanoic acid synthase, partial [Rhizobiales bacterium]|nr:class I poly(R)-hydroxyalkanoic acid synthase [Hyphomicrobiales bacterium]